MKHHRNDHRNVLFPSMNGSNFLGYIQTLSWVQLSVALRVKQFCDAPPLGRLSFR